MKELKLNDGDEVLCPGCGSSNLNVFHKIHGHCSDCGLDFEIHWIKPEPALAPKRKGISVAEMNDYRRRVLIDQERRAS